MKERYCTLKNKKLLIYRSFEVIYPFSPPSLFPFFFFNCLLIFFFNFLLQNQLPISLINLLNGVVETNDREIPFCFSIIDSNSCKFILRATSKRDFIEWVAQLHSASLDENIPNRRTSRVGSEAYIPDEIEVKELQKETQNINNEKIEMAETLLRTATPTSSHSSQDSSSYGRRASTNSSLHMQLSPEIGSDSLRSGSAMNIFENRRSENPLTTIELVQKSKKEVDLELESYISEIEVQLVKLRFLNKNNDDEISNCISLCEKLKTIANEFLGFSVASLMEGNLCKKIIQDIQQLGLQHTDRFEKKFITSLLFILSPISRLIQYQKHESLRKLPDITKKIIKKTPTSSSSSPLSNSSSSSSSKQKTFSSFRNNKPSKNNDEQHLHGAISLATKFLFASMGISIIDSIKAQNAPILSPVVKNRKSKSPRSTTNKSSQIKNSINSRGQKLLKTFTDTFPIISPPKNDEKNSLLSKENIILNNDQIETKLEDEEDFYDDDNELTLQQQQHQQQRQKRADDDNVQILEISCSLCSENFQIHLIHEHALYCNIAISKCDYPPGGYDDDDFDDIVDINWNHKIQLLDRLILDRINELYIQNADKYEEFIKIFLSVHTTLASILKEDEEEAKKSNSHQESQESQEENQPQPQPNDFDLNEKEEKSKKTLDLFIPILNYYRNNIHDQSIFAYISIVYKILHLKHQCIYNNHHDSSSLTTSTLDESLGSSKSSSVSINDFRVIKRISRGAFGRVDLVQQIHTQALFAMKTLDKDIMVVKNLVDQVMLEREILSACSDNDFVVKMFYAFHNSSKLFLLMEYLPGGDCSSLLENIGYFDEHMARCYIGELIMALDYLHSKNIVHRDVKPDNLLISSTGHIKLTDFGLSMFGMLERQQEVDEGNHDNSKGHRIVGTPDYLAPEALLGTGGGKPTIDWWSVGITLYEFLTGIPPFNDSTPDLIFERILSGSLLTHLHISFMDILLLSLFL